MNGHVFQCSNETIDKNQFNKTLEALEQYIAKNVKYPGDMISLTKELTKPKITEPLELDPNEKSGLVKALWNRQVDSYYMRSGHIESNLKAIHTIVWAQCSKAMRAKLKSLPDFDTKDGEGDSVWLLKSIRATIMHFETETYVQVSLTDAWISYYNYRQGPDMTLATYVEEFRTLVEALEHYGGSIGIDSGRLKAEEATLTDATRFKSSRDKAVAILFLRQADRRWYGALWEDLANQFSRGNNQYPKDLTAAHALLVSFKQTREYVPRRGRQLDEYVAPIADVTGVSFAQAGLIAGTDGAVHKHITCFGCQAKGHYSNSCPKVSGGNDSTGRGVQLMQVMEANTAPSTELHDTTDYGFTFVLLDGRYDLIPPSWVLLDSQLTISVFRNKHLLSSVRDSDHSMKVFTNGGTQTSSMVGEVRNFGTVWYNPNSLANILSLAEVRKKFRVTMDSAIEAALCVH